MTILKRPLPAASTTTTGVDSANNTSKRQRRNNYLKEVVGNTNVISKSAYIRKCFWKTS